MRWDSWVHSRKLLSASALGLLAVNLGLSVTLAVLAFRPHPFILTPTVKESQVVVPGEAPPDAVRRFALHYLYYLDDYTASTLKDRSNYVLRYISPAYAERAAKDLTDRLRYAERAREAAQLVTPPPSEVEVVSSGRGTYRATVQAVKRIYIGDRLTQETTIRYLLELASVLPTSADPFGFVVTGQSVEAVNSKEAAGPDPKRFERRIP
jgi:hypothetical protein